MKFTLLEKKENTLKLEVSIPRIFNLAAQKPEHYSRKQVEALVMKYALEEYKELKRVKELKIEGDVQKMWNKFAEGVHEQVVELSWEAKKVKKEKKQISKPSSSLKSK